MKNKKKDAPKLPRFIVPKSMKSITFMSKKDKMSSRKKLNMISNDDLPWI